MNIDVYSLNLEAVNSRRRSNVRFVLKSMLETATRYGTMKPYLSYRDIQLATNIKSRKTIAACIKELEAAGFVDVDRSGTTNVYEILYKSNVYDQCSDKGIGRSVSTPYGTLPPTKEYGVFTEHPRVETGVLTERPILVSEQTSLVLQTNIVLPKGSHFVFNKTQLNIINSLKNGCKTELEIVAYTKHSRSTIWNNVKKLIDLGVLDKCNSEIVFVSLSDDLMLHLRWDQQRTVEVIRQERQENHESKRRFVDSIRKSLTN